MAEVDRIAKRVGPLIVQHGDLMQAVQTLCPDKDVNHLVLCRGTDRMMGPSKTMHPGEAPLRRMICIRRRFEDIFTEPEWERWENMSCRKLRRTGTPARCNLTIVARRQHVPPNAAEMSYAPTEPGSPKDPNAEEAHTRDFQFEELPVAKRARNSSLPTDNPHEELSKPIEDREAIDLAGQKHGPLFLALRPEEQMWVIKRCYIRT